VARSGALYAVSRLSPLVRVRGPAVELFLDERLQTPLLRVRGSAAGEVARILAGRFLTREVDGSTEILIPLPALPAVEVWLLASLTARPEEELLERLLEGTPRTLADLVADLIEISARRKADAREPLITGSVARKASRIVREALQLYLGLR
jgi:hypothetical protein